MTDKTAKWEGIRTQEQGRLSTIPRFGQSWISDYGQQQIAALVEQGVSPSQATLRVNAESALQVALARRPNLHYDVPGLIEHLRPFFPPNTHIAITSSGAQFGASLDATDTHFVRHNWYGVLSSADIQALEAQEEATDQ